jgi:hypothetical protein
LHTVFLLQRSPDFIWELPRYLCGIDTGNVAVETLPLGDPRFGRVGQGDEALEDLGGAALDLVRRAREVEELFAVGASFVTETLCCETKRRVSRKS